MSQGETTTVRIARTPHLVQVLPRDAESLAKVLGPAIERIDPLSSDAQLLIITPDVESTVALVAGAFSRFGGQGVDVLPATGVARAARLLRSDPVRAIAGPPFVLRGLVGASALRLGSIRTIVFAWVDALLEPGNPAIADIEAVLAEAPREADRILVVRDVTPAVEQFTERHLARARRLSAIGAGESAAVEVEYIISPAAARPGAMRRVLDEVDPPSAVLVTRLPESETDARDALKRLGYRRADDAVRVARTVPANTHTVILYDPPSGAGGLQDVAEAKPARIIALIEADELAALRRITGGRARPYRAAVAATDGLRRDEKLRDELRRVLEGGFARREIAAIEPMLGDYDGVEIAAALLRLLERERERVLPAPDVSPSFKRDDRPPRERPPRRDERPPRRDERPRRGPSSDARPRGRAEHTGHPPSGPRRDVRPTRGPDRGKPRGNR